MNSTIFNYVDSILFDKQHLDDVKYDENQYNSYMVNRWCSMCTTDSAEIINETTNRYWSVYMQKQDHYEFLLNLMPVQRRKKLNYIKKIKEDVDKKTNENIQLVAKRMELSTREIKMMME